MSWRKSSNSSDVKPAAVDQESSRKVVYVRKDFNEVPSYDQDGEQTGTHWEYMEIKIPKEDWAVYQQVMINTSSIEDLENALCELSKE